MLSRQLTTPLSIPVAIVKVFISEPGSYGAETTAVIKCDMFFTSLNFADHMWQICHSHILPV
jgi:hypothetical protein